MAVASSLGRIFVFFLNSFASSEVRDTHEGALDAGESHDSEKPHTRCIGPLDRYQTGATGTPVAAPTHRL